MRIKVWGILTISKIQFILIECFFIFMFLSLSIFFFSYDFPKHISDPLVLFHIKYTKYISLIFTFLTVVEAQLYLNKFIQKQLNLNKEQKLKIEKQKNNITASIRYASRIQNALLPTEGEMPEEMEHFIFFHPKDIVSGDYYWIYRQKNKTVFVAADCTGHGVPGAFMSALGIAFLNEIVNLNYEKCHAHLILNRLREKIREAFFRREHGHITQDGMDMALCIYDSNTREMEYAGALNPIFVVRKKQNDSNDIALNNDKIKFMSNKEYNLYHFKPNRMPIGVSPHKESFTSQKIKLQTRDTIYMFSDGYIDQLGGKEGKRFLTKQFKKLLLSIQQYSMERQKELLWKNFNEWMSPVGSKGFDQLDDLLIIGMRLRD